MLRCTRRTIMAGSACLAGLGVVGAPGPAAASGTSAALTDGLARLADRLTPAARPAAKRARVHAMKAELIVAAYDDPIRGVSAARVILGLDCVATNLQIARTAIAPRLVRARIADARACRTELARLAAAGGADGLRGDLAGLDSRLKVIRAAAQAGRAFGARATAVRRLSSSIVARRFGGETLHGVGFAEVYDDLECIDVKLEAGRISGAAACAKRLLRRSRAAAPARAPVTFGSDLTGTPTALPSSFPAADTEFWTAALAVPAAGTVTAFRLRSGDGPADLPLRFSVVRPQPDGRVTVVTTTNPVFPLRAHDAGIHEYPTSGLSFACCKVAAGDLITVDNSGTTTPGAYVFFARRPQATTFSHTGYGDSQNAGVVWDGTPHAGYEVLLQVVLQPG
jgi:hypothetical protein